MDNNLPGTSQYSELIESLKKHDIDAFSKFYDGYSPILFRYIQKSLYEVNASEETLENCFCTMWKLVDQWDASKERLLSWSINIASKEVRRKKIHLTLEKMFACRQHPSGRKLVLSV